ncbi:C-type mannose receptor 2-like [Physella acuta]|uniref:C-type mannose receptor 2-like n=1 Tax=Physella acuta TaxID=109671 RepID=UPI0027DAFE16|nr:C-type mannose receptor 2-like [Physella acuta]
MAVVDALLVVLATSLLVQYGASITLDDCPAALARDRYLQVHGDLCYEFVVYRQVAHAEAESDCEKNGGTLVLIKSAETQDYVTHQLTDVYREHHSVWIGLDDILTENTYLWEDGTPVTYSHWASGNGPDASGLLHNLQHDRKDCVALDARDGGKWKEFSCESTNFLVILSTNERHSYVCQYLPGAQVTVAATESTLLTHTLPAGTTMSSITHPCPPMSCNIHCSVYKKDPVTGCVVCECEA